MKNIIYAIVLTLYTGLVIAQGNPIDTPLIVSAKPYLSRFVTSCDVNSSVVNLSFKMKIPKSQLTHPNITNEKKIYYIKSKNESVAISIQKTNSKIVVWLNGLEKHCFTIDSTCRYSFQHYFISKKSLEIYGKIGWGVFYRNVRLIFYFQQNKVLFDFDDQILTDNRTIPLSKF